MTVPVSFCRTRALIPAVGNPEEGTILELAETIRELTGSRSPITFVDRPVDDPTVRCPDTTLAWEQLGWHPVMPNAEGLRRTIDWFVAELAMERPTGT